MVHYRPGEAEMASEVLGLLEGAWQAEIVEWGFAAPLPDEGACGPDDRFDVFIWNGHIECYVDVIAENPNTPWWDFSSFMVVDPGGPYGGDLLDVTLAHELHHASQAAADWYDAWIVYEMTATAIEEWVHPDDNSWMALLEDFQARPDDALDRYDEYETWFMYGAALYLHFLNERYFASDPSFVATMWEGAKSPLDFQSDPEVNEPDYQDALDSMLQAAAGVSYLETVPEFARWRFFTGARDDGLHFAEGALFPPEAAVPMAHSLRPGDGPLWIDPEPMATGSLYVEVVADAPFEIQWSGDESVQWILQALPGLGPGSDGETIELNVGSAHVEVVNGQRVLVLTALPLGPYDPDDRTDARYGGTLTLP
jgi:hypothetical protein